MAKSHAMSPSVAALLEDLRKVFADHFAGSPDPVAWVRFQRPVGDLAIATLLERLPEVGSASYWCDRDHHLEWAGWGMVHDWVADPATGLGAFIESVEKDLAELPPGLRLCGGWAMDPSTPRDPSWASFGPARFWAPLLEWGREGKAHYLAVNAVPGDFTPERASEVLDLIRLLADGQGTAFAMPRGKVLSHDPSEARWLGRVEQVLKSIGSGLYDKLVLARASKVAMEPGSNPMALLGLRSHANLDAFMLRREGSSFWGLSPERLLSRNRNWVWSEALAATRPRGATSAQDLTYEKELLDSDKDRREQAMVREHIQASMARHCAPVQAGLTQVRKFQSVQHLWTPFQARLKDPTDFSRLCATLHPTPAVALVHDQRDLSVIRDLEGFDRGWYGGVIGWIGAGQAELAVGIRCCLSQGETWTFFTGAGIVAGSHGHKEWRELDQKLATFGEILS